jgi:MFS family permease
VSARLIDRTGKGIRGAPRDALISDVTEPAQRGAAFGLRQSLDTVGAVLGPLLAIGGMIYFASDVRTVLWVAVIPGAVGVLLIALLVREPEVQTPHAPLSAANGRRARISTAFAELGRAYWRLVLFGALLMFARGTEAFLVLRASNVGLADTWTPLTLVIMSLAYALTSWPAGHLSDRMPRERLLVLGLVVLIVSHMLLSLSTNVVWILGGTALWGVHMGLTQGIISAMLADRSPKALRGTAFGVYATASGVALLASGAVGGLLWQRVSPGATFMMGAIVGLIALLALRPVSVPPSLRG